MPSAASTEVSSAAGVRLHRLRVRDWRNIERLALELPPDGLLLIGENGQGKTNLLEAIAYFSLMRSSRGARDVECIRFGAEAFHLGAEGDVGGELRFATAAFQRAGKRKRVALDGSPIRTLSAGLGILPSVLISPNDVALIVGSPALRRRYLDITLALSSRPYLVTLQQYRGALMRRNAALRSGGAANSAQLDVWEDTMAVAGSAVAGWRRGWVDRWASSYHERCALIGERATMRMRYASGNRGDDTSAASLRAALQRSRPNDARRGLTHVGPHRDDLRFTIDDRALATFGSAGQHRTAAFALRLLETETLREQLGGPPVLLLDDPFIELDAGRAERIACMLLAEGAPQTILAVPDSSAIPEPLAHRTTFTVAAGSLAPMRLS